MTRMLRTGVPSMVVLMLCAACFLEVDGERSSTGECPDGEVCSDVTPAGLRFVGEVFYDDSELRLGPILVGGQFDVGLRMADGSELPEFQFETSDGSILRAEEGIGTFGPKRDDGTPMYEVDAHLTLRGMGTGTTHLRIVDPDNGELFDRISLDVLELSEVRIRNVNDPDRDYLLAGCQEMLGIRLVVGDGESEIRAFDQSVLMRAEGQVSEEPAAWDCFVYDVPTDRSEVDIEVLAGGVATTHTLAVHTLEDDGLTECPVLRRVD